MKLSNIESDRPPIISVLQVKSLVTLMDKFYGDPKNMAAYEKWKAKREEKNRERERQAI